MADPQIPLPAAEELSPEVLADLEGIIDRSFCSDLDDERKGRLTQFAIENLDAATLREMTLDAGATIRDAHAPLGAFTHPGYGGVNVVISHRQSLLEHRAKRYIEEGNLAGALVAASMFDFVGRNKMLADVAERAVEDENVDTGRLALEAMYKYGEDFKDPDRDRAEEALAEISDEASGETPEQ
ncbi:MAG TPA: hypothetical protein VFW77_02150 [Candidatus Saccharimonadales bacterium]|nr:hypothetical protein [Candidatus Saccharimonadales bacterium]